jgi:hypothetical protein
MTTIRIQTPRIGCLLRETLDLLIAKRDVRVGMTRSLCPFVMHVASPNMKERLSPLEGMS